MQRLRTPRTTHASSTFVYTRLACLTLIDATPLAAQEVKALEDLNSAFYLDDITGAHLVPWELRVLNVRLQAMGFGDPRRAVMSYYDLAREARSQIAAAAARHDNSARELWKDRLVRARHQGGRVRWSRWTTPPAPRPTSARCGTGATGS